MATTKLWPVKGRIQAVVTYVTNPEKTDPLEQVIRYAARPQKTQDEERCFVTGINCFPDTAQKEMTDVQIQFGKTGGVIAHHGYQSFAEGEVTPEQAHRIGVQMATELWGQQFQVLVATHLDRQTHLHNHFVINAVSYVDGRKFRNNKRMYRCMREASDRLCQEHGLSVVQTPLGEGTSKSYAEWSAEQAGKPTWRGLVKSDVDEAVEAASSMEDFFRILRQKGYIVKRGKDISVRPSEKERFVRLARNFGEDYTWTGLKRRIHQSGIRDWQVPRYSAEKPEQKNPFHLKTGPGLQGVYLQYCVVLGVFDQKPRRARDIYILLRDDIRKMERISREAQILGDNQIDTLEELTAYREGAKEEMIDLIEQRKNLRNRQRRETDGMKLNELRGAAKELTKRIARLRTTIAACESIEQRSVEMTEKLRRMDQDQTERKQKEGKQYEYRR